MLGDSIPSFQNAWDSKGSVFQNSLTRFWQRAGQLDCLVQKLGACPTTWEAQELSAFTKSPPVSKASRTAEKLVLSTRSLVQGWSFWVSCFFVDTRKFGEKKYTFLLLWDLFKAKVKHWQLRKIQNTPKSLTCHIPAWHSKPRIPSLGNLPHVQCY